MKFLLIPSIILLLVVNISCTSKSSATIGGDSRMISYEIDPNQQQLRLFWKDEAGKNYGDFASLKKALEQQNQELIFAVNGGMYKKDQSPQGLYIENGKTYAPLDTTVQGYGNFYLQPNGVFYLTTDNQAVICKTSNSSGTKDIKYATQSGPMLVIDGVLHSKFRQGSSNLHIRNGIGLLPDGRLLFAMSKEKINFYDFATYFKENGCKNALYLDGFVSRTYLPTKDWEQLEGKFGVIIAETKNK